MNSVWKPCDPRDDQVDPNWSFVRLMKSSMFGLRLSFLVSSRYGCLNSWLIPKRNSDRLQNHCFANLSSSFLSVYLKAVFIQVEQIIFPVNLKTKCNYFRQNHSNSVC